MVCKAVSVKPQTEIKGLNIAEDVTQVVFPSFCEHYQSIREECEKMQLEP